MTALELIDARLTTARAVVAELESLRTTLVERSGGASLGAREHVTGRRRRLAALIDRHGPLPFRELQTQTATTRELLYSALRCDSFSLKAGRYGLTPLGREELLDEAPKAGG